MGLATDVKFGEKELSALNAKADALSDARCDASGRSRRLGVSSAAPCVPPSGEFRRRTTIVFVGISFYH